MSERWSPSGLTRSSRLALLALLVTAGFCAMAGTAMAKKPAHVNIVSHELTHPAAPPNTTYYETIQAAVNASHKGDWVLIEPGTYPEQVLVTKANQGIHIRGMNRNTVVLDGENKPGNGILIEKANDVWVENLTAHDYDGDAAIWWTGGTESKKQKVHGWFGKYLTAYQTDQGAGYGIFTQNEHGGWWEHVYASGFNDSGLYIGACWECQARVTDATIEKNSVGYSGSNSGGSLVIEKSIFRDNGAGIVPNGENPGDGPPPQNGMCNARKPGSPYHVFTTTNIERCTVFKENLVTENNNLETPVNGSTEIAPWGVGVLLPGDMADLVENNTITKNVNNGVLGFEYPNPYPPEADTIFYQFTGNKIANNTFSENGGSGKYGADDITLEGGLFPYKKYTSNNNCSTGNTTPDGVEPLDLETTFNCSHTTTPPPLNALLIQYVIELSEENAALHKGTAQPAPGPQPTMPEPCENVPANPLCP